MDLHADSKPEFVVSTSDYAESTPRRARNPKPLVKSFSFLPSLLRGRLPTSIKSKTRTRKYSETKQGRQAAEQPVNNYYITGGFGGSGGEGLDQGGDGGAGHGPTVYFGRPQDREPFEFRTIRLGDLKLVKEVRLSLQSGVVGRQIQAAGVRRIYHAEIRREPGPVTVAMYQGDGAEEEWRQHVAKYEAIRHPHIMQLYGLVRNNGLYAMVFHDELIPYVQFLRRFQHSTILSTYIIGYCTTEFEEAANYIYDAFRKPPDFKNPPVWIQPRTGGLCLDLAQGGLETGFELPWCNIHIHRLENGSLDAPNSEDMIISSLSEDQYHNLCSERPIARIQPFHVSTQHLVGPGISRLDSQYGTCVRVTEPLIFPKAEPGWIWNRDEACELLPNSWVRYDSRQTCALKLVLPLSFWSYEIQKAWLAQANRIFAELGEVAHVEDYVCVNEIWFVLRIADKRHIPKGYLFVCPPQNLRIGIEQHAHLYQWPARPAYWSLDTSGTTRLSTEDARILGFPAIHIETIVYGLSWDHSVYKGLRRFHAGKGFNPDGREVARRLGYPLYEVLSDQVPVSAHRAGECLHCEEDDPALCQSLGHYL
ncbi:hypothetical protein C8R45DRAFT_501252 [Mycena sanguinolenta]|nr:hypothetical protein C8R45DRAFT_501252 [Mycena sanguinolenta]